MPTLPIDIQTRSLRQPLRRALATAAELGADGVEIDLRDELRFAEFSETALRQFRKLLEDLRLKVSAAAFPTRRGFDEPQDLERRILATREAMSFAYKIGARVVIGRAGEVPAADRADSGATLVESLGLLASHGDRVGARFAFVSAAPAADQQALLERLPEGTLGVALHPGRLLSGGQEPAEAASVLGPHVLHLHAADAVREGTGGTGATEVALGRGEADLPAVLATLEEHGYRGPVTVERREGADPASDVANAVAYVRTLLRG